MNTTRTYYAIPESLEAQALATQTEENLAVAMGDTPGDLAKSLAAADVDLCIVRVLVREGDTLRKGAEKMRTVMLALRTAGVVTSKETTQFRVHATKAATAA
jgi:hypothetical protein